MGRARLEEARLGPAVTPDSDRDLNRRAEMVNDGSRMKGRGRLVVGGVEFPRSSWPSMADPVPGPAQKRKSPPLSTGPLDNPNRNFAKWKVGVCQDNKEDKKHVQYLFVKIRTVIHRKVFVLNSAGISQRCTPHMYTYLQWSLS